MLRIFYLFALLIVLVPASSAVALEAGVVKFVKDFRQCMPDKQILRIGVLGFRRDEESLSRAQQTNIRQSIEELIQRVDGVVLTPSSDLGDIIEIAKGAAGSVEVKIRKQIANARRVDGVVLFNMRRRQARKVIFQLTGITKMADCKKISEPLTLIISNDKNFANVEQVLKRKSKQLLAANGISKIAILPFLSAGGLDNSCNRELTDRMSNALLREQSSANRTITGNSKLYVRKVEGEYAVQDKKQTVIVEGKSGCNDDGSHWIRIDFQRAGNAVIPSLTKTSITGLNCSCRIKTFFERVRGDAKLCPTYFKMRTKEKKVFVGDYVNIAMSSKRKAKLYCWYLAEDKTAYILVPNPHSPGSGEISPLREKRYPRDFGFPEQQYLQESNDMFGCFVREKPLPAGAHAYWMKRWGPQGGAGSNGELVEGEIVDMLKMMRRLEGTSECYLRVNVKNLN